MKINKFVEEILCFGDSNTYGLIPGTKNRYGRDTRWTGLIEQQLYGKAAEELEFEKAASLRDKILSINAIAEKQKIFKTMEGDEDFINIEQDEKDSCIQVFFSRDGKVIGREHFIFENTANEKG